MKPLAERYAEIAPDRPGFGLSDPFGINEQHAFPVEWGAAAIGVQIARSLIGHSVRSPSIRASRGAVSAGP